MKAYILNDSQLYKKRNKIGQNWNRENGRYTLNEWYEVLKNTELQ